MGEEDPGNLPVIFICLRIGMGPETAPPLAFFIGGFFFLPPQPFLAVMFALLGVDQNQTGALHRSDVVPTGSLPVARAC